MVPPASGTDPFLARPADTAALRLAPDRPCSGSVDTVTSPELPTGRPVPDTDDLRLLAEIVNHGAIGLPQAAWNARMSQSEAATRLVQMAERNMPLRLVAEGDRQALWRITQAGPATGGVHLGNQQQPSGGHPAAAPGQPAARPEPPRPPSGPVPTAGPPLGAPPPSPPQGPLTGAQPAVPGGYPPGGPGAAPGYPPQGGFPPPVPSNPVGAPFPPGRPRRWPRVLDTAGGQRPGPGGAAPHLGRAPARAGDRRRRPVGSAAVRHAATGIHRRGPDRTPGTATVVRRTGCPGRRGSPGTGGCDARRVRPSRGSAGRSAGRAAGGRAGQRPGQPRTSRVGCRFGGRTGSRRVHLGDPG